MEYNGVAVAGQLQVALDGEIAHNGGGKGAGAVFDDAIGAVMQAAMGDGTRKERFGHEKICR
ncbi:hypothetical protein D9M68_952560 [compost metagenome]